MAIGSLTQSIVSPKWIDSVRRTAQTITYRPSFDTKEENEKHLIFVVVCTVSTEWVLMPFQVQPLQIVNGNRFILRATADHVKVVWLRKI